jgi:hypothetical protein
VSSRAFPALLPAGVETVRVPLLVRGEYSYETLVGGPTLFDLIAHAVPIDFPYVDYYGSYRISIGARVEV